MNLLKRLWPCYCLLCQEKVPADWSIDHLCQDCLAHLPWNAAACLRCANPLPLAQPFCGQCLTKPPLQTLSHILFDYVAPISEWINAAKFQNSLLHCQLLGQLFAYGLNLQRNTPWPELLIPMPLHRRRLRQRGYNQSLEIIRPIAKALTLPIDKTSLIRHQYTQAQTRVSLKMRKENVRGSFSLRQPLSKTHIALFDDVSTSGSTLKAASIALCSQQTLVLEHWCLAKPF